MLFSDEIPSSSISTLTYHLVLTSLNVCLVCAGLAVVSVAGLPTGPKRTFVRGNFDNRSSLFAARKIESILYRRDISWFPFRRYMGTRASRVPIYLVRRRLVDMTNLSFIDWSSLGEVRRRPGWYLHRVRLGLAKANFNLYGGVRVLALTPHFQGC